MKLKITSMAVTGLLLLTSACASNVSTNTTTSKPAPTVSEPVATTDTTDTNGFPVKTRTASEITALLGNDNDRIFFETNSANISDEANTTIELIAPVLANNTNTKFIIEGHADERGTRAYNLALGKKRANALKNALVSNNVNSADITTITYGKDRPYNTAHNAEAWAQNRRAVVVAKDKQ